MSKKNKDFREFKRKTVVQYALYDHSFFLTHQDRGMGRFDKPVGQRPPMSKLENAYIKLYNHKRNEQEE